MSSSEESLNWLAIAALYLGLILGIGWLMYWGDYRNAVWLILIGIGGGFTAYGRVLETDGRKAQAQRWQWAGAVAYLMFILWAGIVLIRTLTGG